MSDFAPTNAVVTVAQNSNSVALSGVDVTTNGVVLPGMNLYFGSRTTKAGTGYKIQSLTPNANPTTGATLLLYDNVPTAYANAPFIVDTLGFTGSGATYVASLYVTFLTFLFGALGDLASLASGTRQFILDKAAAANESAYVFKTAGRLWAKFRHIYISARDVIALTVYPDGTTPVAAFTVDAATGGFDHRSAGYAMPAVSGQNQTLDLDTDATRGFRKLLVTATGSNPSISSFGTGKNVEKLVRFDSAITLVNGPNLVTHTAANLVTVAGDHAWLTSSADVTPVWHIRQYQDINPGNARFRMGAYGSGDSPTFSSIQAGSIVAKVASTAGQPLFGLDVGTARWRWGTDASAEGGSNAGSNFSLFRYSDAGGYLGNPLVVNRATGVLTFNGSLLPGTDNNYSIGQSTQRFNSIYSVNLFLDSNFYITGGSSTPTFIFGGGYQQYDRTNNRHVFGIGGNDRLYIDNTAVFPTNDTGMNLGKSTNRFNNTYLAVSPTIGSDGDIKTNGRELPGAKRNAVRDMEIVYYRLKAAKAEKAELGIDSRKHIGVIAQQIVEACERHGVDPWRWGLVGRDPRMVEVITMVPSVRTVMIDGDPIPQDTVEDGRVVRRMVPGPQCAKKVDMPMFDEKGAPIVEARVRAKLDENDQPMFTERREKVGEETYYADDDTDRKTPLVRDVIVIHREPVMETFDFHFTMPVEVTEPCEVEHVEHVQVKDEDGNLLWDHNVRYDELEAAMIDVLRFDLAMAVDRITKLEAS